MIRCGACGKFLSAVGGTRCSLCPALYHKACIGVPEAAQIASGWMCPECKIKMPKTGNTATPVKQASNEYHLDTTVALGCSSESASQDETAATCDDKDLALNDTVFDTTEPLGLGQEMRLFRKELREFRRELKEFRAELFNMRSAITGCNQRIDDIDARLQEIEKGGLVMSQEGPDRVEKMLALEETVAQLQGDLNERDQELLLADIEIKNLPEGKGENPIHTVTILAAKLGVHLDSNDVIFAERVGGKLNDGASQSNNARRDRRLMARLARRSQRDELLQSARVRHGVTTADMDLDAPARRFYINERLTKNNRHLFYLAREAARKMQWKYTWTKRGRIYARKGEGQSAHTHTASR